MSASNAVFCLPVRKMSDIGTNHGRQGQIQPMSLCPHSWKGARHHRRQWPETHRKKRLLPPKAKDFVA